MSKGTETEEVLCDSRKVHMSKSLWNMVPNDRRSVSIKAAGSGNWAVTNKHFTGVGEEQIGLKNKWKAGRKDGECRSLCSESWAVKREPERC